MLLKGFHPEQQDLYLNLLEQLIPPLFNNPTAPHQERQALSRPVLPRSVDTVPHGQVGVGIDAALSNHAQEIFRVNATLRSIDAPLLHRKLFSGQELRAGREGDAGGLPHGCGSEDAKGGGYAVLLSAHLDAHRAWRRWARLGGRNLY